MEREDEIDLRELVRSLWHGRLYIAGITFLAIAASMVYAVLATQWYRAEVVISPADSKTGGINLGQLGSLASLAGASLPGATGSQAPLAVLKSRDFARQFIEEKKLGPIIFPDTWPKEDAAAGPPGSKQKDIRDAVRYFTERVQTVSEDKKSGLVTLTIRWTDPQLAAAWANELVSRINEKLRAQALVESERNTKYLQQEIAATNVVALQQSIGRVLEAEMQKFLLAKGNPEFAFKVIDVATVPKYRESPKRATVVIIGAMAGFMLSCLFVLIRPSIAKLKS